MKILIGCEESQIIMKAFRARGHDAWSCDLKPCSGGMPEYHFQCDVLSVLNDNWDMAIFHPTCTYLSNAGISYFNVTRYGEKALQRVELRKEAEAFFMKLYNAPINKLCIENPVGWMNNIIRPTQIIHPFMFGDAHKKRTCLWLKSLPKLIHIKHNDMFNTQTHVDAQPIYIDKSGKPRYFTDAISGGTNQTQELRSKSFAGIAKAMAHQWG